MAATGALIVTGKVEYVENSQGFELSDEVGGCRIKVRLNSDGNKEISELPWAFPILPKFLQTMPKVGEGVFVITSDMSKPDTQRYYLGPIISQPQYMNLCSYGLGGRGPAMSLISTSKPLTPRPLTSIFRQKNISQGAFPDVNDIAILGRGQEDMILKYRNSSNGRTSEIDLRAGIRLEPSDSTVKYMQGNVAFNNQNPAYIQVKYGNNGLSGLKSGEGDNDEDKYESPEMRSANGVVNVVADKINLISHKDNNSFGEIICDRDNLIKEGELDQVMSLLHRSVYGDELIVLLKKIVSALVTHTHPYSMLEPTVKGTELEDIVNYEYEKIISPHVRIS